MTARDLELIRQQLTDLQFIATRVDTNVDHLMTRMADVVSRLEDHSERISESATDIARWKALEIDAVAVRTSDVVRDWQSKIKLVVGVSTFVGVGGFLSMLTLLFREFSK